MGGLRNGKGFGVCKAYFGVYAGCFVSCVKFWFCSWLRFWRESKGWRFLQALVFSSLFVPAVAYAVPGYQSGLAGVIQGPSAWYEYGASVDDPYYGYFCYAYDKYDAAVWSLGLDPTDARFTSEVKAKLSNASTGGRFYTYAEKFHTFGTNSEPHAWLSRDFYGQWVTLYGRDFLYWGEVTTAEQDSAKADLQTILNGGSLGGSIPSNTYPAGYYYKIPTNINNYAPFSANLSFGLKYVYWSVELCDAMSAEASRHGATMVLKSKYDSRYSSPFPNLASWYIDWRRNYDSGYTFSQSGGSGYIASGAASQNVTIVGDLSRVYYKSGTPTYQWASYSDWVQNAGPWYYVGAFNPDDFEKVYLDPNGNNWPESDPVEAPQPPELPEPDNPVIDDEPDPTFPVYVDVSTTNYTADLQGVLDAMDDHCVHLQESIWWGFNNFWNKLYQYITWSVGVMQAEFSATRDYLHDLFHWLAEQFDFSVSGGAYNDSTVVSWLKKIYSTLGLGVNTRPSDPVADPDGIGDWLGQLFANFIAWLAGFGAGLVAGLADDFAELTTKFPFSIPWDIGAMLALVVAEPVAPSFEYPLYTLDASGSLVESGVVEVDLSVFDSYMVGIRFMQKLLFCLMLAWRTADLKELLRIGRSR